MNGSRRSGPGCPVSAGFTVEGLPPLPKGLSGILNSSGGSWRDIEKVHSKRARIQADISRGSGGAPRGHGKPGGLAAALALLRKEMVRWSASILPLSVNSTHQQMCNVLCTELLVNWPGLLNTCALLVRNKYN